MLPKTSSIWNACDPVIMPRLSRLKSIKHNWPLWIALKKENICYGKDFPAEAQKNGKKCKTAWGLFQAGLLTGDACAWHYKVAWMKWGTQTATIDTVRTWNLRAHQRILQCPCLCRWDETLVQERLSDHVEKAFGSDGDNDVSPTQSIQGEF